MESKGTRETILDKITQALKSPVGMPFPEQNADKPVFVPTANELTIDFAEKFTGLLGKFI